MKQVRKRLTYANVMSSLAVFMILGGATAVAAQKVRTADIRAGAVTTNKIRGAAVTANKLRKNAVRTGKIRGGSITGDKIRNNAINSDKILDGSVTGAKVADGSLSIADLGDVAATPLTRMPATEGPDEDAARSAAPGVVLYSNGPLALYGKCYTDTGTPNTFAAVFASTNLPSTVATVLEPASPLIGPGTPEVDRMFTGVLAELPDAAEGGTQPIQATAPNGVAISGIVTTYVKQGNLPGGNGPFGEGDACLFTTQIIG